MCDGTFTCLFPSSHALKQQRSSAKCTEKFKDLQCAEDIANALVLLLDMKVRWSSTYIMLRRALSLKGFVNDFVYVLSWEETNKEKRRKIDGLELLENEWQEVALFCELLKVRRHCSLQLGIQTHAPGLACRRCPAHILF